MTLEQELEHVKKEYNELADRLKERDRQIERLVKLLDANGIDVMEVE